MAHTEAICDSVAHLAAGSGQPDGVSGSLLGSMGRRFDRQSDGRIDHDTKPRVERVEHPQVPVTPIPGSVAKVAFDIGHHTIDDLGRHSREPRGRFA